MCAKAKSKDKAEISRVNTKASKRERDLTKARVREKVNAFQKAEAKARQGQGRNIILQVGRQWRLLSRSGPVPRSREKI